MQRPIVVVVAFNLVGSSSGAEKKIGGRTMFRPESVVAHKRRTGETIVQTGRCLYNEAMSFTWPSSTVLFSPQTTFVYGSLYRVGLSILVLLVGVFVARKITSAIRKIARSLFKQKTVAESPLGTLFDTTQSLKGSGVVSHIIFWTIMLLFLSIAGEILGITLFTNFVSLILGYIPMLLSALIVLGFGVVISGVVERVVKKQFKRLAPQQSVLAGTLASYFTLSLFALIALSELGIASDFILVLFAGFVMATALSIGLAIGLGAKDLVRDSLTNMVNEEKQRRQG